MGEIKLQQPTGWTLTLPSIQTDWESLIRYAFREGYKQAITDAMNAYGDPKDDEPVLLMLHRLLVGAEKNDNP